jgi:hypothetical protein
MENEERPLHDQDLKSLLELFEVPDEDRSRYFDELRNAQERGWWELYDENTVPGWYTRFIGLEQGAEHIRAYQPAVVHGLLQTREYSAALFREGTSDLNVEMIARRTEVRLRRQKMLRNGPRLEVLLDEAVLRHVVGTKKIMKAQLEHLAALCRANELVTVQVVPFDHGGATAAAHGPFTLLTFGEGGGAENSIVYRERHSGAEFFDSLAEIDGHSLLFQRLSSLALSSDETLEVLERSAEDYGTV